MKSWSAARAAVIPAALFTIVSGLAAPPARAAEWLPDSVALARVDDRVITAGDYRMGYLGADVSSRPRADLPGRTQFLGTMIDKELLGITAAAAGRPLDFEQRAQLRLHADDVLARTYYQIKIIDPAKVSEPERRASYEQFKLRMQLRSMVFGDRSSAEQARADLVHARRAWLAVANRYAIAVDSTPLGRDGWLRRDELRGPQAPQVFALQPGGISPVFHDDAGFRIWQCLGRASVPDPPPYAGVRLLIEQDVKAMRMAPYHEALFEEARRRAGMRADTANVQWLTQKFLDVNRPIHTDQPTIDLRNRVPTIGAEDTSRVLGATHDARLTVGDLIEKIRATPSLMRTKITGQGVLFGMVDRALLEPTLIQMARAEHVDQRPDYLRAVSDRREALAVDRMYQDSVMAGIHVTQAQRRAYYDEHRKEFVTREWVRYAVFVRWSKAGTDSLIARLDAGAKPEDVIAEDERHGIAGAGLHELYGDQPNNYHGILFEELKPGQSTSVGPGVDGGYIVFRLIEHTEPHPMAFEQVESIVDESVQNIEAERRLHAWLDRLRRHHHIETHPELLARVNLSESVEDAVSIAP